jgi:hypothetical protein
MTARKIDFYLTTLGTADQQGLFAQASQLTRMQRAFTEFVPPRLSIYCTVGWISKGNLTIYACNGAIAAKLKQISPSLLLKFKQKKFEITAIRVAVQAHNHFTVVDKKIDKDLIIGPLGLDNLSQLAARLPASPLKSAVESLLKKQIKSATSQHKAALAAPTVRIPQ